MCHIETMCIGLYSYGCVLLLWIDQQMITIIIIMWIQFFECIIIPKADCCPEPITNNLADF